MEYVFVPHQDWDIVPWEFYFDFSGVRISSHHMFTTLKSAKLRRH